MLSKPAGAACAKCPARDGKLLLPTPTATGRAALAIVDDAPSSLNFKEGSHISGPAARMLARGFAANDLPPPAAWHRTSAVLCECPLKEQAKAAKCCGERLRAELAACGAPIVVPLGGIALQQVMGSKAKLPLMKHRGFVHRRTDGAYVLPIMHPWRAQQLPKWLPILERDVARIGRIANDGFTLPEERKDHEVIYATTPEHLARGLAALAKRDEVIADVETVGLGPTSTSLVCLGLGNIRVSVVIPWSKGQNGEHPFWLNGEAVARDVTRLLASRTTVTHNGPAFDHIVMTRYGFEIVKWEDTLLETHALRGHMPKGLAFLVSMYVDSNPWKTVDHAQSIEDLWYYNAQDLIRTSLVYEALKREMWGSGE
jgi:uracil-DNA glycosylase